MDTASAIEVKNEGGFIMTFSIRTHHDSTYETISEGSSRLSKGQSDTVYANGHGCEMWPAAGIYDVSNLTAGTSKIHEASDNVLCDQASIYKAVYHIDGSVWDPHFHYDGLRIEQHKLLKAGLDGARWHSADGARYVVLDQQPRHIPNPTAHANLYAECDDCLVTDVSKITFGPDIAMPVSESNPTGTAFLAKADEDPKVYLFVDGKKRWITSPEVFQRFGFNYDKIYKVPYDALVAVENGRDIV